MKFKFTKKKVLGVVVVCFILAFAFWWGGNAPGLRGWNVNADSKTSKQVDLSSSDEGDKSSDDKNIASQNPNSDIEISHNVQKSLQERKASLEEDGLTVAEENKNEQTANNDNKDGNDKNSDGDGASTNAGTGTNVSSSNKNNDKNSSSSSQSKPTEKPGGDKQLTADEKIALAKKMAGSSSPGVEKGNIDYSEKQGMVIDKDTHKDKYMTDPVPTGKPIPVEPQNVEITDIPQTCTLSVRCDTILENIDWLDKEKVELVPEDGVIYAKQTVTFYKGESVFNVLLREMKKNKIHMEYQNTPMYNSAYIEGISNLYEFDCGELSGWMYKVNGWFPNYGCSRYQLKQGDVIEWVYTCNLGVDVGGFSAVGGE